MMVNIRDQKIFYIAVPSIISNITVPLLGLVDLTIAGHFGNASYIGAIAVGSMIFNVIYWIFGFLRMGSSGMTSQALGCRDFPEVIRILVRTMVVGFLIAMCFIIFQIPLRWTALQLIHPSAEVVPLSVTYFDICIWGAPSMLCLYGLTGWLIGMQNTRIPMVVSIFQNVVNIIASLSLVYFAGMKIEGIALGTLIAQWSGFIVAILLLLKYYSRLSPYFDINWRAIFGYMEMSKFFTVNRDIFVRTFFLVAVNLFFTSAGAHQGDIILAVNTLLMTFFTLFSYVMDGFAYAGEALSGKYYGARNKMAFTDVCHRLYIWGGIIAAVFSSVYAFCGNSFIKLLTNDATVIATAQKYFWWAVAIPVVGVAAFIYDGIFIGITATRGMLISSCISSILFFALYFAFHSMLGNHALWFAFIIYLAMRGLIQNAYFNRYCRII